MTKPAKWLTKEAILKSVLSGKGYKHTEERGWVNVYSNGTYDVILSDLNPDVWVKSGNTTLLNAEGALAIPEWSDVKFVKLLEHVYTLFP